MRRDETTTPDDLDRPEGNGLKANYDKHDVGEAEFIERCDDLGLVVEEWGIDMRHDGGESGVIYDDAMDFKVYSRCDEESADAWLSPGGEIIGEGEPNTTTETFDAETWGPLRLAALVDVKTKGNPRYMGRFNQRHFENYADHSRAFGVPTFVLMFQVDYRKNTVDDEFVFQVPAHSEGHVDEAAMYRDEVLCSKYDHAVDAFPDGNHAVLVRHSHRQRWASFVDDVVSDRATVEHAESV